MTVSLRPDLALVAEQIPDGSRVLDLGCGSGTLLAHLMADRSCTGTGVEIDAEAVLAAIDSCGLTPANNNGSGQIVAAGTVEQIRAGGTLDEAFVRLVGGPAHTGGLSWLQN